MAIASTTLIEMLGDPARLVRLPPGDQTRVIRQARQAGLLGFLAARIEPALVSGRLSDHLLGAKVHADYHHQMITWETDRLARALDSLAGPVILLKGAAYKALQLDFSQGRLATDVDILVPRDQLPQAEQALLASGWEHMKHDQYEQHYYREWSHELPPLRHKERGTVVDLHHNILPSTARLKPDAAKLIRAARPMEGRRLYTLSPTDSILHRVAHLFFDGDLQNGLRELLDIHELISAYREDKALWAGLVPRARELDLARPLYYALICCRRLLRTGVPDEVLQQSRQNAPSTPLRLFMQWLMLRQLRPRKLDRNDPLRALAGWLLFLRSHWLRMPPLLLAKHLLTQVWRRGGIRAGT
jgi:hypothetical protein